MTYVVKPVMGANEVLAEILWWFFSRELDVPSADGAVWLQPGEQPTWASRRIALGIHWSAQHADRLVEPHKLGRILGLDAYLGNFDRNRTNLLVVPTDEGMHRVRVFAIDAASSWAGTPRDLITRAMTTPEVTNHANGIPIDAVEYGAQWIAQKLASMADERIEWFVREAAAVTREPDDRTLSEQLISRAEHAHTLIEGHLANLRGLK